MRIYLSRKEGLPFFLAVPTRLVGLSLGSRLAARLVVHAGFKAHAGKGEEPLPPAPERALNEQALQRLLKGLGQSLCQYRGLVLAEAQTGDGFSLKITL